MTASRTGSTTISRAEHLAWAKARALVYADAGDNTNALASFASDLGKHDETEPVRVLVGQLGLPMMMSGHLDAPGEMRRFIEGFN